MFNVAQPGEWPCISRIGRMEKFVLNSWFGKQDAKDPCACGSQKNGNGIYGSGQMNERRDRGAGPVRVAKERNENKLAPPGQPPTFEQICQAATVKPPKLTYGIQKVAEMANSSHLNGMTAETKRKALLMALDAASTDVGEVLNDVVARQRALKEYEESFLEKVNQFEAARMEEIRQEQAELDNVTSQFRGRIQASLDEVEHCHQEFRAWQKNKQQELQRFTEAAGLCVPQEMAEEEENDGKVTSMLRPTGTFR